MSATTKRQEVDSSVSCDDCNGACCRDIGGPPGYVSLVAPVMHWDTSEHESTFIKWRFLNLQRWPTVPDEAKREVIDYVMGLAEHGEEAEGVCIWLGEDHRCRWYEHRPQMCRAYGVGSPGCLECRAKHYHRERVQ